LAGVGLWREVICSGLSIGGRGPIKMEFGDDGWLFDGSSECLELRCWVEEQKLGLRGRGTPASVGVVQSEWALPMMIGFWEKFRTFGTSFVKKGGIRRFAWSWGARIFVRTCTSSFVRADRRELLTLRCCIGVGGLHQNFGVGVLFLAGEWVLLHGHWLGVGFA